jgi:hypothetical protein
VLSGRGGGCCAGVNSWGKSTHVVPGFPTLRRRRDPRPPAHHAGLPRALARGPLQVLVPKSEEDRTSFTLVGNAADYVMTADVRPRTSRLTRSAHPPTPAPKTFPADDPAVSSGGHHHDAPPLGLFVTLAFTLLMMVARPLADRRAAYRRVVCGSTSYSRCRTSYTLWASSAVSAPRCTY